MMKELRIYRTRFGGMPFLKWLSALNDRVVKTKVQVRLDRLILGNYGDCKGVGDGVYELRIHSGPGYRVYFSEINSIVILILFGGTKSSQKSDIAKAKDYWKDFKERYYEK